MLIQGGPLCSHLPLLQLRLNLTTIRPFTSASLRKMSSQVQIPKTMKAIRVEKTGGPEVNTLEEIPVPVPKDDEVLIKVQWTGTNYIDNYQRGGLYKMTLPFTPGQDVVGTIVSLPKSQTSSTALPALEIGQTVLSPINQAFAEYVVAPWWKAAPIPEGVDAKLGVPAATTAFTMAYLVKESYEVKKGDWVLVRAAAGGVGLLLCQICKHKGANVIATTSSPEKAELAKQNGAHHVLLTTTSSEENIKTIKDLTGGKGVHVVYDGVGKDTFDEDFEVVRPKGTLVMYGNASGAPPEFSVLRLMPKSLKITRPTLGTFISTPEDFAEYAKEILDWIKEGALKFTIHKEYPFTAEGVSQSQIDIVSRGTTGKLLIHVSD